MIRITLLAGLLAVLAACIDDPKGYNINDSKRISDQMVFFRHPMGICFAYAWVGPLNGSPALSTVPCEKVEKFLIDSPMSPEHCTSECYRSPDKESK
jgi:hypothetical protein